MGYQRAHTISFHFADLVGNIALKSVKEVEDSCPGLAWVGGIWILPGKFSQGNSICGTASKASLSMSHYRSVSFHVLQLGPVMECPAWGAGGSQLGRRAQAWTGEAREARDNTGKSIFGVMLVHESLRTVEKIRK